MTHTKATIARIEAVVYVAALGVRWSMMGYDDTMLGRYNYKEIWYFVASDERSFWMGQESQIPDLSSFVETAADFASSDSRTTLRRRISSTAFPSPSFSANEYGVTWCCEVITTDLVLTVTQIWRKHGVVGKFVEFYGEGTGELSLTDMVIIANMSPEYVATMGFIPMDHVTLQYLKVTGRSDETEEGCWYRWCRAHRKKQQQHRFCPGDGDTFLDISPKLSNINSGAISKNCYGISKIREKHSGVAPSEDNDTLSVGNICNFWTKEIKRKMKEYGIENVEGITLVAHTRNEGLS